MRLLSAVFGCHRSIIVSEDWELSCTSLSLPSVSSVCGSVFYVKASKGWVLAVGRGGMTVVLAIIMQHAYQHSCVILRSAGDNGKHR